MAAASFAAPGTEAGPCVGACEHHDCASTRRQVALPCVHCGQPIGYDTPMFNVTPDGDPAWSKLAHAACEYRAIEASR